ncbi:hypothetical protein Tco_0591205 [Tanacetum coccineum]
MPSTSVRLLIACEISVPTRIAEDVLICKSFNGQKQQRIDLNADALYNAKQENLRVCSDLAPQRQMVSAENNTSGPVVRLGINPMIQPEPEDLPKDNPKLEIAVLSLESKLQAHKLLFKDVMGKLVKRVKILESKLKARGRNVILSESDNEEHEEQDVDSLIKLAKAAAIAADTSSVPADATQATEFPPSSSIHTDAFVYGNDVPTDTASDFSADPSNKGKSPMVEEDPPIKERSFRQMEEGRLGAEQQGKDFMSRNKLNWLETSWIKRGWLPLLQKEEDSLKHRVLSDDDYDDSVILMDDPTFFWNAFVHGKLFYWLGDDLSKLYGMVVKHYEVIPLASTRMILWGDLHVLFESTTGGSSFEVWNDQQEFECLHIHQGSNPLLGPKDCIVPQANGYVVMAIQSVYGCDDIPKSYRPTRLALPKRFKGYLGKGFINSISFYDLLSRSEHTMGCDENLPTGRYVVPTGRVIATVSIKVPTGSCSGFKDSLTKLGIACRRPNSHSICRNFLFVAPVQLMVMIIRVLARQNHLACSHGRSRISRLSNLHRFKLLKRRNDPWKKGMHKSDSVNTHLAFRDDDSFMLSIRSLPIHESWLGNRIESAIAVMAMILCINVKGPDASTKKCQLKQPDTKKNSNQDEGVDEVLKKVRPCSRHSVEKIVSYKFRFDDEDEEDKMPEKLKNERKRNSRELIYTLDDFLPFFFFQV